MPRKNDTPGVSIVTPVTLVRRWITEKNTSAGLGTEFMMDGEREVRVTKAPEHMKMMKRGTPMM